MSGDTNASEDGSKRFTISTEEHYETTLLSGHNLILETYVKDNQTGKKLLVQSYTHKLPKSVPKYITRLQLWHHTRGELLDLQKLTKQNKERKPSNKTLEQWKQSIQNDKIQNVLQSHNPSKQKTNTQKQ